MGNLINGRTPEEIKAKAVTCTMLTCSECPYEKEEYFCAANDVMDNLLAYVKHLEAQQPKWISVEERLPENDDLVLVRANGRARETRWDGAYVLATYGSEGWVLWDYEDDEVQHLKILQWVPLPEPPMEKERDASA